MSATIKSKDSDASQNFPHLAHPGNCMRCASKETVHLQESQFSCSFIFINWGVGKGRGKKRKEKPSPAACAVKNIKS